MSIRITQIALSSFDRAGSTFRTVAQQPSWVLRAALIAFLVIIGVPIALLVLLALCIAVVVFSLLAAFNWVVVRLRQVLPRSDGRSNVTVIERQDTLK